MSLLEAFASAVLALTQAAPAPPPQSAWAESEVEQNTVEEIVVQSNRKAVSEFVRQNAAPTKRGRLARWDRIVCPGVVGFPKEQGTYLVDRIALEAQAVGLRVGQPGCAPNILVLVTDDAQKAAADLKTRYGRYFAERPISGSLLSGGGDQTLAEFVGKPRPVRWWHVSELQGADGQPLESVQLPSGPITRDPAKRVLGVAATGGSRLASNLREDLSRALIIVDTTQLKGVTYEALASYLAMVSLAQLDPEAEPGTLPSILTLFRRRDAGLPPPETMSQWDRAYLRGLYAAPANARNAMAQKGAIRRSLSEVGRR